jgi:hypothetical protein
MTYYADLSNIGLFESPIPHLLSIGWLEKGKPFQKGKVHLNVIEKLKHFSKYNWNPMATLGFHKCDFCNPKKTSDTDAIKGNVPFLDTDGKKGSFELELKFIDPGVAHGNGEILIPYLGKIYCAPDMVIHYIESHDYLPPSDFLNAVINCPEMLSQKAIGMIDGVVPYVSLPIKEMCSEKFYDLLMKSNGKVFLDAQTNTIFKKDSE